MSAPTATTQAEPLLDLQRLVAGIRWRRRTWLALSLLGLVVGGVVGVVVPHPTAVTRILVVRENEDAGDGEALIKTDVALFQSSPVAAAALEAIGSDDRPEQLLDSIVVTGLTGNVLEVTVPGRSDADAVARAQALADAFIADHVKRTQDQDQALVEALTDRRTAAEGQLDDLNKQIVAAADAPGANSPDSAAELEALYARRASLTSQAQALGQQVEEAGVGTPQVQAGTRIVDPPRAVRHSQLFTGLLDAGFGLLLGLGLGIAVCAVATVTRDRPVLRRDIAANLGASVIAQVPAPRRGLLRRRRSRGPTEVQRVAGTIARLSRDADKGLSFLALGSAGMAAELAVRVADELSPERSVELVDDLPDGTLGPVAERIGSSVPVVDGSAPVAAGGIRLGVGSIEPGAAWTDLRRLGPEAVLVVRAGHAATSWMHTAARQLADGSVHVIGVVLVNPDPRDRSDGTLWNGLQMALRGRQVGPVGPRPKGPHPEHTASQRNGPEVEGPTIRTRVAGPSAAARARAGVRAARASTVEGPTVRASALTPGTPTEPAPAQALVPTQASADPVKSEPRPTPRPEPEPESEKSEPESPATSSPEPDAAPNPPAGGSSDPHATVQLEPVRRPAASGDPVEVTK